MGAVELLVSVSCTPPGDEELVMRKTSFGGLKKVIRLEVSDEEETVMSVVVSERPGTKNGPRLMHVPSFTGLQPESA